MPSAWRTTPSPRLAQDVDSTIYELHIRDYSMSRRQGARGRARKLPRLRRDGDGRAHLKALAKAGLNTVHLLPSFDIASIEEDPAKQETPQCDLASYAPDSEEQQKCVAPSRARTPSTGATTPTTTACRTARTRRAPRRPTAAPVWPSSAPWSGPCTRTACGSCSTRSSTTRALGPGGQVRARQGRAGLLPPAQREWRGRDLDVLPERRHRARDGREADGRLGRLVGAELPASTASAST